jgi:hypothetical protein
MYEISVGTLVENLSNQGMIVGLFLAGAGLAFMLLGIRIFRALVVVSFGVIGFLLGIGLPLSEELARLGCGLVAATGLAMAAAWAMKPAVAFLAGGWSGFIVMGLMYKVGATDQVAYVLGIFAFIVAISLAYIAFHEIVAFVTSLEGSFLCVGALIVFFSQSPTLWAHLRTMLVNTPTFGAFLILAGTVTGFYLQLADLRNKDMGVSI